MILENLRFRPKHLEAAGVYYWLFSIANDDTLVVAREDGLARRLRRH